MEAFGQRPENRESTTLSAALDDVCPIRSFLPAIEPKRQIEKF